MQASTNNESKYTRQVSGKTTKFDETPSIVKSKCEWAKCACYKSKLYVDPTTMASKPLELLKEGVS